MAAKSIIEIEVRDGAFKSFQDQFNKYQVGLKNMPGQWGAVGKSISGASASANKFAAGAALVAQRINQADIVGKKLSLTLKAADRTVTSLARGTGTMARNIKDATTSLLKWGSLTSLFSGLLGAGGLFGIARMAGNVSAGQSQAGRTGSSYGASSSAQTAYGQLFGGAGGVQSLMEGINIAKHAAGNVNGFNVGSIGISQQELMSKSAADLVPVFVKAMRDKFVTFNPSTSEYSANAMNMTKMPGFDFGTLTQLGGMSSKEVAGLAGTYESSKRSNDLSRGTQDAWANFDRTLENAGKQIENVFINGITPLIPAFSNLSKALANALGTIIRDPHIKEWTKDLGDGIQKFAKYLTANEFKDDIAGFLSGIDRAGGALWDFAQVAMKITGKLFDVGNGLTASEHQAIERVKSINPAMAEKLEYAERHKENGGAMAQVALMMQNFATGKGGTVHEGVISGTGRAQQITTNQRAIGDIGVKLHILNGTGGDVFAISNGASR